jgi:hypothetical protein
MGDHYANVELHDLLEHEMKKVCGKWTDNNHVYNIKRGQFIPDKSFNWQW